jgi:hypothetical protein
MKHNPFCSSVKCSLIENRTFYNLSGHHVLNHKVLIRNCEFIGGDYTFELNHEEAHLHRCKFVRQFGTNPIVLGIKGSITYCCFTDCWQPFKLRIK